MTPIIGAEYPKIVIPMIDAARGNIDIVIYDWRWYPDQVAHPVQRLNAALVRAAQRGVQVRAVVNAALHIDTLNKAGIKARQLKDRRTLHTKMMLIDNKTLILGSHNFTRNAFGANIESSVAIELPEDSHRWADFFNNLYGL